MGPETMASAMTTMLRSSCTVRHLRSYTLPTLQPFPYRRTTFGFIRSLHQFVVYAPDYTDEGALQRRLDVREKHLGVAKKLHEVGAISKVT